MRDRRGPLWQLAMERTPADVALLLLVLMVGVGLVVSVTPRVSLDKAMGFAAGVAVLRVHVLCRQWPSALRWSMGSYLAANALAVLIGFLASELASGPAATGAMQLVLLPGLSGFVNANALAVTCLLGLPIAVAAIRALVRQSPALSAGTSRTAAAVVGLYAVALVVVLALCESRTAWVATGMGVVIAAGRLGIPLALMGVAAGAVWVYGFGYGLGALAFSSAETSLLVRQQLMSAALDGIQEFPITGIGLNSFREVMWGLYALPSFVERIDLANAHNVFLQTALDVGLPGLIAYLAVLLVALAECVRAVRHGDAESGVLALGVAGVLVAVHLFGLLDAVALGAKVGVFIWWSMGLALGLGGLVRGGSPSTAMTAAA